MESAIGPCAELVKCVGGLIDRRINQLWNLRRNLDTLKEKRDELVAKESDVKSHIGSAQGQGKLVLEEVSCWLEKVEKVKSDTEDLFAEHMARCFCSNCCSRWKLAKRVVDKTREVVDLVAKQLPDPLVIDPPKPRGILLNPPLIVGGESTSDKILNLLKDPKIGKIGVWGMGGVGKTTIMKAINDELVANYKQEFSQIIWVTASKDNMGGVEGLQDRIARHFGDYFGQKLSSMGDDARRAGTLHRKLKEAGNFVLIIDDLWAEITLNEVGIPEFDGDQKKGKIVVTTRELLVCDSIDTQVNVEIDCLPEEAAWELFVSKAGEQVRQMSDIEPLARQVLKECAGLPLAIITVGCAMKRKQSSSEWSHALNVLRNSTGDDYGLHDKVFKPLRFSYDNLTEEAKSCFLYCAFYPEDHPINPVLLIEHWIAEGYTSAGGSTSENDQYWDREAEISKGFYILGKLKDACLLHGMLVGKQNFVRMHDLVRDLAIRIMGKDFNFISKAGMDLKEWPEKAFATARKISMMDSYLETFPDQPNCPNLSTLFLGRCSFYKPTPMTIPMLFFSQMLALRVLDISHISMTELPKSIFGLVGLRALFLEYLEVKKIPSLAKLKKLRTLSMRRSFIKEAPAGMEALVNLRFLDLEGTRSGGFLNFNGDLISKLTLLEELRMRSSYLAKSSEIATRCIEGIAGLKRLTNLDMSFYDVRNYLMALKHIQWNKLKGFFIHVYPDHDSLPPLINGRPNYNIKFVCITITHPTRFSTIQLPSDAQELWLQGSMRLEDSKSLACYGGAMNQSNLLESQARKDNVHLLPGDGLDSKTSLENLTLRYFNFDFDVFCRQSLQEGGLTNLKNLTIEGSWLKNLSTCNTLQQLKNLELLKVLNCVLMEEIIEEGSAEATSEVLLPKLHTLILSRLPRLHHISSKMAWICDSLKAVAVFGCPKLEQLPFIHFPASGIIYGTSKWWEGLQWENPTAKDLLQSHFKVANENDAEIWPLVETPWVPTVLYSRAGKLSELDTPPDSNTF